MVDTSSDTASQNANQSVAAQRPVDPTPEEIAAACLAIQAEWSEPERRRRAGLDWLAPPWTVPRVSTGGRVAEPAG